MRPRGHIGLFALAIAFVPSLVVATPASAQEREPIPPLTAPSASPEETVDGPPPEAAPPPRRRGRSRLELAPSAGWMRTSAYGVPIDLFEAQLAVGAAFAPYEDGVSFDVAGVFAWEIGKTESGRTAAGSVLGIELITHYRWLRAGLGGRFGFLGVQRSTRNDTESGAVVDGYVSLGVEPFSVGGSPFFVEARLHGIAWADTGPSVWLGAGFRWCNTGCPK
jgi:hypothetical protein